VAQQKGEFEAAALADTLKAPVGRINDHLTHLKGRGIVEENTANGKLKVGKADQSTA